MGTGNFYYKNASQIFAICMSREVPVLDEEGEETDEMEYQSSELDDINDTLSYIADTMEENKSYYFRRLEGWDHDNPRTFDGNFIGSWSIEKQYAGVSIEAIITAKANSGYYEGACLDFNIETFVAGNERDEVEEDDLTYYGTINKGLAKILAPKANAWLINAKDKLCNDLELLFGNVCEVKLKRVATFNNGETIYEKT